MSNEVTALAFELRQWAKLIGAEPRGARDLFNRAADAVEALTPEPPTDDEREALALALFRHADPTRSWDQFGEYIKEYWLAFADTAIASDAWRNRHRGPITDEIRQAAERLLSDVDPKHRPAERSLIAEDIRIVARAVLEATGAAR